MRRRDFIKVIGGSIAAWPLAARAQQSAMPVVGFLGSNSTGMWAGHLRAFCHGLSVLIWILFLVYVAKPPIAIDDMGEGRTFGVVQRAAKGLSDWRARGRNN